MHTPPRTFAIASWLFLKALGAIYVIAFLSFGIQAQGLIGSNGLLPLNSYLAAAAEAFGTARFWTVPTIFWISSGDWTIRAACIAGVLAGIAIMAGVAQRAALAVAFALYLSVVSAGQTFMAFQWDLLLLETGFIAIFLNGSRVRVWFFWWLLFRLLFLSGAMKLTSGDETWRTLTALRYHYETQPLPTPLAWYMHQLAPWFQSASEVFALFAELVAPLFIFAPRRWRQGAAAIFVLLQALIALTGNYAFFNVLTIALCVLLFEDSSWPRRWIARIQNRATAAFPARRALLEQVVTGGLLVLIVPLGILQIALTLTRAVPRPALRVVEWVAPFGIVNGYGLFANMTTQRIEIVVEGSEDGVTWRAYEFRYKPGSVGRMPPIVAPYQPRLDWQMWFAALGSFRENPFFVNLMVRLLEGSRPVLALLASNPFPGKPPEYVRAMAYRYRFTTWAEKRTTGAWWRREFVGQYFPAVSLKSFSRTGP
jgi:hypothetical protein